MTRYAGEVDGGGEGGAVVGAGDFTGESGVAEGVGEFVEAGEARAGFVGASGSPDWRSRPTVARSSLRAERLASRTCARASLGLVGALVHHMGRDSGLHVDEGDVVGDDVVQVAGDTQPLLGDAAAGLLVAGALGAVGAFADGVHEGAAASASPAAAAMPVQAKIARFSCAYQGRGPTSIAQAVSTVIVSRPTRQVVGRSVVEATV